MSLDFASPVFAAVIDLDMTVQKVLIVFGVVRADQDELNAVVVQYPCWLMFVKLTSEIKGKDCDGGRGK